MHNCPECGNAAVEYPFDDISDTNYYCSNCASDLYTWWVPENFSWLKEIHNPDTITKKKYNPSWLEYYLSRVSDFNITSCTHCASTSEDRCYGAEHKFITFKDLVSADISDTQDRLIYNGYLENFEVPLENFYNLTSESEHITVPVDCRSCVFYQTHKCLPLVEALDDLTVNQQIHNISDEAEIEEYIDYALVPCQNFSLSIAATFASTEQAVAWRDAMDCYYEVDALEAMSIPSEWVNNNASNSYITLMSASDRHSDSFHRSIDRAVKEVEKRTDYDKFEDEGFFEGSIYHY